MESIQIIKPKTLSCDKFAYLSGKSCILDFNTSMVLLSNVLEYDFPNVSKIIIKDLYNNELETATSNYDIRNSNISFVIPDIKWYDIPINILDVGVFNSISSTGESIFWHSIMKISKNFIKVKAAGYIYFLSYEMPKLLEWIDNVNVFEKNINMDHNIFYYLYQMFRKTTKTKLQTLSVGFSRNQSWITNETRDFYIIINDTANESIEKNKSFSRIDKFYTDSEYNLCSILDRVQSGKDEGNVFKHLTKCLGDKITKSNNKNVNKYSGPHTDVFINRTKDE